MKFHVITLFPEMFKGPLDFSIVNRAKNKGAMEVNFIQLRDFAVDKHGRVDEKPYGGGTGMLLMAKPIFDAVRSIKGFEGYGKDKDADKTEQQAHSKKVILLSPRGKKLTQQKLKDLSLLEDVVLICGRYEGVDQRVSDRLVDEEISIGDYVLSGAEIPAMVIIDGVSRLLDGVLVKDDATVNESFSVFNNGEPLLEYPQYTRPEEFEGMKVPDVLLSGNHKEIEEWKKNTMKSL